MAFEIDPVQRLVNLMHALHEVGLELVSVACCSSSVDCFRLLQTNEGEVLLVSGSHAGVDRGIKSSASVGCMRVVSIQIYLRRIKLYRYTMSDNMLPS